jgi:hypothetical protein
MQPGTSGSGTTGMNQVWGTAGEWGLMSKGHVIIHVLSCQSDRLMPCADPAVSSGLSTLLVVAPTSRQFSRSCCHSSGQSTVHAAAVCQWCSYASTAVIALYMCGSGGAVATCPCMCVPCLCSVGCKQHPDPRLWGEWGPSPQTQCIPCHHGRQPIGSQLSLLCPARKGCIEDSRAIPCTCTSVLLSPPACCVPICPAHVACSSTQIK